MPAGLLAREAQSCQEAHIILDLVKPLLCPLVAVFSPYPLGTRISSLTEPKDLGRGSINLPSGTLGLMARRATSMVPRAV